MSRRWVAAGLGVASVLGGQLLEPGPDDRSTSIRIEVGGETFGATVDDSVASRDLLALLPVTVEMADHGGVEKTGPLPSALSTEGRPAVGDPAVGDLGYYAPGQDLVLYHGDQSAHPGIVVLGRLDAGAAERLAAMPGSVTATVTATTTTTDPGATQ